MAVRQSISRATQYTFLRNKRKWPQSPYKTHKWDTLLNQQQALLSLQKSADLIPPSSLLTSLLTSFTSHHCHPTPTAFNFILKSLSRKSHFNEVNTVLTHIKKVQSFDTPEYIFADLIRVYGDNGMFNEAVELFFDMPQFRCVPTVVSLNSLLLVLCRSRDCFKIVPQVILKSRVLGVRIEESSFCILVNALCRIGKVGFAIELLNVMIEHDFEPGEKIFSLILSSLCRRNGGGERDCSEVLGVFEGMKRVGFCPGREDFRNVVTFLAGNGRGMDAFGVFCEMKREGFKPDIGCYNMVLYGLVEEGEFPKVDELFDEILLFGLSPNLRTYNVYISGLCRQKKVEDAYMLIGCMKDLCCSANSITYCTVLEGICKVGSLSRAREIWKEMEHEGVGSNPQAYGYLIPALVSAGELTEACTLLEEMISLSCTPMPCTIDEVVCSLCHEGRFVKALDIVDRVFRSHSVVPGLKTWEALLRGGNLDLDYVKAELAIVSQE